MNPPISFACRPSPSDPNSPPDGTVWVCLSHSRSCCGTPTRAWSSFENSAVMMSPLKNILDSYLSKCRDRRVSSYAKSRSSQRLTGHVCSDPFWILRGRPNLQPRSRRCTNPRVYNIARTGIRQFRPRAVRQAKRKSPSPRARRASYGGRANRADGLPSSPRRIRRRRARGGRAARTRPRCA